MKRFSIYDNLFYSLVGIMVIIIISPLLIKFECVRNIANFFIIDLYSMKGDYLGMLGTLIGSCLAITGALWAQKRINDNNDFGSVKKSAKLIVFDLERTFKLIKSSYISKSFWLDRVNCKIKLNGKWDENILAFSGYIKDSEIDDLMKLYDDIYVLSSFIEKLIDSHNEIEESTYDFSYQSGGGSQTTIRNKTAEKYSEECDRLIDNIVKKIMSISFIDEILFDHKEINDLSHSYKSKEEESENFRVENKIPNALSGGSKKDIDPEITKRYQKHEEIKTEAWNDYINGKDKIMKKWKIKLETSSDTIELNCKYKGLINTVKKIYS